MAHAVKRRFNLIRPSRLRRRRPSPVHSAELFERRVLLSGTVSVVPTDGGTTVVEGGAIDSFTIALDVMPTGPVDVILDSSGDQVQLSVDGGASFGSFRSVTLSDVTPVTVLVQGYEDGIVEGTHSDTVVPFILNSADPVNYPFSTVIPTLDVTVEDPPSAPTAGVEGVVVNGNAQNRNRSGIASLAMTFDQAVSVSDAAALRIVNQTRGTTIDLSDVALSGNGSSRVTWELAGLKFHDGRYTAELPKSEVTTIAGGTLDFTHTFAFHVLHGDVSGDTQVNFDDTQPLTMNFGAQGDAYISGDADGDGTVDFNDTAPQSQNFGKTLEELTYDFGDAPETGTSFQTMSVTGGARHVVTGNVLFLGASRDSETDGLPAGEYADEDGVTVDSLIVTESATVTVNASAAGFVNGWIDFNQDGDWDDPGEHVMANVAVIGGDNSLQIPVPADAVPGGAWSRFRLTGTAGYGPGGLAPDGEVEDYLLTISDPIAELTGTVPDGEEFAQSSPTEELSLRSTSVRLPRRLQWIDLRESPPLLFRLDFSLFDTLRSGRIRRR